MGFRAGYSTGSTLVSNGASTKKARWKAGFRFCLLLQEA